MGGPYNADSRAMEKADQVKRELFAQGGDMHVRITEDGECYMDIETGEQQLVKLDNPRTLRHNLWPEPQQPKGVGPWLNWYISRGIIPYDFTAKDLRRISHRRVF